MSDPSSRTHGRRRYNGGRTRGGGGIGIIPVILLLVFVVLAWKFHLGALPSPSAIRGFFSN